MYSIPFPLLRSPKVERMILFSRWSFVLRVSCGINGTLGIPCGMKWSFSSLIS